MCPSKTEGCKFDWRSCGWPGRWRNRFPSWGRSWVRGDISATNILDGDVPEIKSDIIRDLIYSLDVESPRLSFSSCSWRISKVLTSVVTFEEESDDHSSLDYPTLHKQRCSWWPMASPILGGCWASTRALSSVFVEWRASCRVCAIILWFASSWAGGQCKLKAAYIECKFDYRSSSSNGRSVLLGFSLSSWQGLSYPCRGCLLFLLQAVRQTRWRLGPGRWWEW